jgi:hypothetical protein
MHQSSSPTHLASYVTGAVLGAGILVGAIGHGLPVLVQQARAAGGNTAVARAQALRDRMLAGGSAYAAAEIGLPTGAEADAWDAEHSLRLARANVSAACGLKG